MASYLNCWLFGNIKIYLVHVSWFKPSSDQKRCTLPLSGTLCAFLRQNTCNFYFSINKFMVGVFSWLLAVVLLFSPYVIYDPRGSFYALGYIPIFVIRLVIPNS